METVNINIQEKNILTWTIIAEKPGLVVTTLYWKVVIVVAHQTCHYVTSQKVSR